ncbi:RNase H family protein [Lactobacillus agrestimuris]|uniref:RNase H family protein n=1 Tax=Lactobacillus agrestimuris TaxID=2941328 RepID=UPI0020434DD9|nr:RNase H family protein [Lactobacillus agrestimuris]
MSVKNNWIIINDEYQPKLLEEKVWSEIQSLPKHNYRGFKNKEEAEVVFEKLSAADLEPNSQKAEEKIEENIANLQDGQVMIFTDGSYKDQEPKRYGAGWGYVSLYKENGKLSEYPDHGYFLDSKLRQVSGEIEAVKQALSKACTSHFTKVDLYCDFLNLILWDSGFYQTTEDVSKEFVESMKDYHTKLDITFHWAPSHEGIKYNDEADIEAKVGFSEVPTNNELYGELNDLQEKVANHQDDNKKSEIRIEKIKKILDIE